jgi:hypothetical protein
LGYNPVKSLLGPVLAHMPAPRVAYLTGRGFFPHLIAHAFGDGLHEAFYFALAACAVAAGASWLRGGKYHYVEGAELGRVVEIAADGRTVGALGAKGAIATQGDRSVNGATRAIGTSADGARGDGANGDRAKARRRGEAHGHGTGR